MRAVALADMTTNGLDPSIQRVALSHGRPKAKSQGLSGQRHQAARIGIGHRHSEGQTAYSAPQCICNRSAACSGVGDTRLRRLRMVSIFTHQLCVCSILREQIPNMTSRVGSIGFG